MKKSVKILVLIMSLFTLSGCFDTDDDTTAIPKVYTTVYPTEYIAKYLYGDYATVESIYPNEADIDSYVLTNKQIKDYSNGNYFIYNGLSSEKQIAKSLINNNSKLQIIDITYGLTYNYGVEELWLSPNNYLMLAKNVKNNLIDSIPEKFEQIKTIESKYDELEEKLSFLDAELRNTATIAKSNGNNKLLVSSNSFKYLEKYGFEVLSIDGVTMDSNDYNSIRNAINSKKYKFILMRDIDQENDVINKLKEDFSLSLEKVDTMYTLNTTNVQNSEDYLSIMNKYINKLDKLING